MRKFISLLLIVTFIIAAVTLASCGESESKETQSSETTAETVNTDKCTNENFVGKYLFGTTPGKIYFWLNEDETGDMVIIKAGQSNDILMSMSFPRQESDYYALFDFDYCRDNMVIGDINFDGMNDLYLPCSVLTANVEGMVWLWNEETGKLELSDELSFIPNFTVDSENKIISGSDNSVPGSTTEYTYTWENGELKLLKSEMKSSASTKGGN